MNRVAFLLAVFCCASATAARAPSVGAGKRQQLKLTDEAEKDRISYLPGWGNVDFGLYGGYVTVHRNAGRALYYIFSESPDSPETKPLILWLNGGPGCSSLGGGFMSELGPFFPKPGGTTLQKNPNTWAGPANVIFLESPAFVGFSYSNRTSDQRTGDRRTTDDNLEFLIRFFDRFPQYRSRPLWLSGESYAGHYVPLLAQAILRYNDGVRSSRRMQLEGMMVGNPWTDPWYDNKGQMEYLVSHSMLSRETADRVIHHCAPSAMWPLPTTRKFNATPYDAVNSSTVTTAASATHQTWAGHAASDGSTDGTDDTSSTAQHGAAEGSEAAQPAPELVQSQATQSSEATQATQPKVSSQRRLKEVGRAAAGVSDDGDDSDDGGDHGSDPDDPDDPDQKGHVSHICRDMIDQAADEVGPINLYDIYEDTCTPARSYYQAHVLRAALQSPQPTTLPPHLGFHIAARQAAQHTHLPGHLGPAGLRALRKQGPSAKVEGVLKMDPNVDPCVDAEVDDYLNRPEVQLAIHANTTGLPGAWTGCSYTLHYSVSDCTDSMLPVYRYLIHRKLRIMVYSGTVDAAVPITGTQNWIDSLRLGVLESLRPWMTEDQVGGHVVKYDGITLVLVRNAGHMVPYTQPERALHLMKRFVNGKEL